MRKILLLALILVACATPVAAQHVRVNGVEVFVSNVRFPAGAYWNFGTVSGESGYGIRDNAGTIQFKNSAGVWTDATNYWTRVGTVLSPATAADSVTLTGAASVNLSALVVTPADGFVAGNVTAALVGTPVQISPRMRWTGNGWDVDDAVSRPVRFYAEVLPASDDSVTGTWRLGYLDPITSGSWYPFLVTSTGNVTAIGTLTVSGASNTTGNIFSQDVLKLLPATSATRFTGSFTPADLTADVTWTFPAASGTVALVGYGDMFAYESVTAITITETNTYQAVNGIFSTGTALSGVTFTAGKTGPIASVADGPAAGTQVTITDVAHGLVTGDYITIAGTTNYDGTFYVTRLDNDTFWITETNAGTDTGTWRMGDYLTITNAGVYAVDWSVSAQSASSSVENYKIEPVLNATDLDSAAAESTIDNGAGISVFGGGAIFTATVNARLWIKLKQETTGEDNITFTHGNIRVRRIGS